MWLTPSSIRHYEAFKDEAHSLNKASKCKYSKAFNSGLADIEDHQYEFVPPAKLNGGANDEDEENLEPAPKTPAAKTPRTQKKRKSNDDKGEESASASTSAKKKKAEAATPTAKQQQRKLWRFDQIIFGWLSYL